MWNPFKPSVSKAVSYFKDYPFEGSIRVDVGDKTKYISKENFIELEKTGLLKKSQEQFIKVFLLDPIEGLTTCYWKTGQQISNEQVEAFKDWEKNCIYAISYYKDGENRIQLVKKDYWEQVCLPAFQDLEILDSLCDKND